MSDNIYFNKSTEQYSIFSVKDVPWHRKGIVVEHALTSKEAISIAGLDYTVLKLPNMVEYNGKYIKNPYSFTTIRSDTAEVLGSVGKDYTVIQNSDAFEFFDSIVKEDSAIFHTAGVIGKGEQVFISAKLPRSVVVDNEDIVNQYLLLSNSHDGSRSVEVLFTPIRVVCQNTLIAALNYSKNRVRIRHTQKAPERLKLASKILGIHSELTKEQSDVFNAMAHINLSINDFQSYICSVFLTGSELEMVTKYGLSQLGKGGIISTKKLNVLNTIATYFDSGPGQQLRSSSGTLWGAYNAITGYYQNVKSFGIDDDDSKKIVSNYYGSSYNMMFDAYTTAYSFMKGNVRIMNN